MKFSVLVSVYAKEKPDYFHQAFSSIWDAQNLKPAQIVLVKDGVLGPHLENAVRYWECRLGKVLTILELDENMGLGAALNSGLKLCSYELVARMDTDDIALPNRFQAQVEYLESHPEIDVLGSSVEEMSNAGDVFGIRSMPVSHEALLECLWACPLIHPTVMMRRSRVMLAGNYNPNFRRRQDYELWFRCAEKGLRFDNLDEPLVRYRFSTNTHKKQSIKIALEQALVGYKGTTRLGMPIRKRLFCFVPFFRSLLPNAAQHFVYRWLKPFDPRQKKI